MGCTNIEYFLHLIPNSILIARNPQDSVDSLNQMDVSPAWTVGTLWRVSYKSLYIIFQSQTSGCHEATKPRGHKEP
jgi:hypothetical protein